MSLQELRSIVPDDTVDAWRLVAQCRPDGSVLMGGTALAVHLRHRQSRDLDLFCHEPFDPLELAAALAELGPFVRTPPIEDGTLNGLLGRTRVQFLSVVDQTLLVPPIEFAGMPVGSLEDIFATKLKVVGDRSELRDYYDLMCIECSGRMTEEGMQLVQARYRIEADHASVAHIVRALGYTDELQEDPLLAQSAGKDVLSEVVAYWRARQPEVIRSFDPRP